MIDVLPRPASQTTPAKSDEPLGHMLLVAARQNQAALELELICVAGNDPPNTIPAATGITPDLFTQPDLRALWCAIIVASEGGNLLRCAHQAVEMIGHYDPTQIAVNWQHSAQWSDASLGAMFSHFAPFPTPIATRVTREVAARLVQTHQQIHDAARHAEYAIALLRRAA